MRTVKTGLESVVAAGFVLALITQAVSGDAWYDTQWAYRQPVTIAGSKVANTHAGFPVLVRITSPVNVVFAHAQSGGGDILFTESNGVAKLSHEIEAYTNAGTPELVAWVRVPTLVSNQDARIYMYYGNTAAAPQQNRTGVWASAYDAVYHLKETADPRTDSTINANNLAAPADPVLGTPGYIGRGCIFDGTNDYFQSANNVLVSATTLTISAWVKPRNFQGTYRGIALGVSAANGLFANSSSVFARAWPGYVQTYVGMPAGWFHAVATSDGAVLRLYINGVQANSTPFTAALQSTGKLKVGYYSSYFNGIIDEVRVSKVVASASWVQTEYRNQSAPDTFLALGVEEHFPRGTALMVR